MKEADLAAGRGERKGTMKQFEIGKTYSMRSPGCYDCTWSFTVTARTAKTITVEDEHGETKRLRISKWSHNEEEVYPLGHYSLCPVLRAI